jgi:hypothetical protein
VRLQLAVDEEAHVEGRDLHLHRLRGELLQRSQGVAQAGDVLLRAQVDGQQRDFAALRVREPVAPQHHPAARDRVAGHLLLLQPSQLLGRGAQAALFEGPAGQVLALAPEDLRFMDDVALVLEPAEHARGRLLAALLRQRRGHQREIGSDRAGEQVALRVLVEGAPALLVEQVLHRRLDEGHQPSRGVLRVARDRGQIGVVVEAQLAPVQSAEHRGGQHQQHAVEDEGGAFRS